MIKKYSFKKFFEKKVLFLTKDSYSFIYEGNQVVYCLSSYTEEIQAILQKHNTNNIEFIISEIQNVVNNGLVILESAERIVVVSPFLDYRLSWFENDQNIIFSDSAVEIAKLLNLKLSNQRIASQFIFGLPYYPFQTTSMWEELSNIGPLSYLMITNEGCLENKIHFDPTKDSSPNKLLSNIRKTFFRVINREVEKGIDLSCDVSGGVDSATIAFTLNKIIPDFSLLHSESKSSSNSDTKWAKYIAKNLSRDLKIFDSIALTEKRFTINDSYINGIIPSFPLLWADSEGYLLSVIRYLKARESPVHFLGIGGDELFTPMPSNPWTIVRQENLGGLLYAIKYSLIMKRPTIKCLQDIFDNTSYWDTLNRNLDEVFKNSSKYNKELSWVDSFQIPEWLSKNSKEESKNFLNSLLSVHSKPILSERTSYQILQSLIFQKSVLRQIQLTDSDIYWSTPFLDRDFITSCLQIPAKNKVNSKITKPMLQKALKGIVPTEIFSRGFKGDYSEALYDGYKIAIRKNLSNLENFELVKMGIVNVETLKIELSLPSGNPSKIDFFERFCAVERWIRQVKSYMK